MKTTYNNYDKDNNPRQGYLTKQESVLFTVIALSFVTFCIVAGGIGGIAYGLCVAVQTLAQCIG